MEASWYQQGKITLEDVVHHFNGMMNGLEHYRDLLARLRAETEEADGPLHQREFLAWIEGQTGRVQRVIDEMDQDVWDHVTRFLDRNIRIKHWQDGDFI